MRRQFSAFIIALHNNKIVRQGHPSKFTTKLIFSHIKYLVEQREAEVNVKGEIQKKKKKITLRFCDGTVT